MKKIANLLMKKLRIFHVMEMSAIENYWLYVKTQVISNLLNTKFEYNFDKYYGLTTFIIIVILVGW